MSGFVRREEQLMKQCSQQTVNGAASTGDICCLMLVQDVMSG